MAHVHTSKCIKSKHPTTLIPLAVKDLLVIHLEYNFDIVVAALGSKSLMTHNSLVFVLFSNLCDQVLSIVTRFG